ncbi:MAG: sugar phosphate isomerase/epimerase [Spirochaetales bacterium]|jgi:sugar phosphate isomerase/epimerase|nr:sugar phosphate isomerase/epimerase [Spirochaetales bacterium]
MISHVPRNTTLGIGSYCYPFAVGTNKRFLPDKPLGSIGLIDKALYHKVKVVQLADNLNLQNLTDEQINEIAHYAGEHDVTVETGLRGISAENLRRHILLSERMGARLLRCVIDSIGYKPDFREINKVLTDAIPLLHKTGITLGIENHDRFLAKEFKQIITAAGDQNIGIVLDTVNSFSNEERSQEVLEILAPYTVCFHVKDYAIRRRTDAQGLVVTGTIAGEGRLDIPYMLNTLKNQAVRDFSTILEFWMEPEETTGATLIKEEQWVEKSIKYLRNFIPD